MAQADRGWGKMLLCIDESPSILRYVRALFERSGFIVVTARSAQRGLELAGLLHFDMVLQDFCLPDMNGHNFALEVKRLQPAALLVIFSHDEIPLEAHRTVNAVVSKTGLASELLPIVVRLFNRDALSLRQ